MIGEILKRLPTRISEQISKHDLSEINEIRMITNRPTTLTVGEKSVLLGNCVTAQEIEATVSNLCGASLHAYEKTIAKGYIPLGNGCRAGVCGKFSEGSITEITSIVIRIPRSIYGIGNALVKRALSTNGGMLLYSPPGVGKTTLLRDIAATLSAPPYLRRVSVIDSRNEIYRADAFRHSIADIFNSYPKSVGIELAVRTMSPKYVVCDELGADEASSILSTQSFGVPIIASAHAPSLEALLSRRVFKELDECGVFSTYVGIRRERHGFAFDISERK